MDDEKDKRKERSAERSAERSVPEDDEDSTVYSSISESDRVENRKLEGLLSLIKSHQLLCEMLDLAMTRSGTDGGY
jgi:hypothetical protein